MRTRAAHLVLVMAAAVGLPPSAPASAQPSPPLSLTDALARARASSPLVEAARAQAEGWRAASEAWRGWENPALEIRTENFSPSAAAHGLPNDTFVVVSQPLPFGGRRRAARDVLLAESSAADSLQRPRELALDLEVTRRYVGALGARELLSQLDTHVGSLGELVRVMESRASAGAVAAAEAARLRGEWIRARQAQTHAQVELARRLAALGALLDLGADFDAARLLRPRAELAGPAPASTIATLVDGHPAVIEARGRVSVSRQNVRFEDAAARLSTTAVGGYKKTAGVSTGVAAVLLTLPVLDQNGVARARASSGVRLATLTAAEAERVARAEMTALVDTHAILARRLADAAPLDDLEVVRTAARARLRESVSDILSVVDAERLWYETRRDHLTLEHEALQVALEIQLRLGREVRP